MLDKIRKEINQYKMLEPGDRVLVGLSGGADSICLLQVLFLLKEEYQIQIAAVHCHHKIRETGADEDAAFSRAFCEERKIPFFYREEEVKKRAVKNKLSVEEAGRQFRYETFEMIMKEEGFHKIAVAHHANDRAETMLFHLVRGTDLRGLASMEPIRKFSDGKILIRPLLEIQRAEIEQWLLLRGQKWRTDETNLSDVYTRNRIRHFVLPELEQLNSQAVLHMGRTAGVIGEAMDFLDQIEKEAEKEVLIHEKNQSTLNISKWKKYHPYLQKQLLYQCLVQFAGQKKDVTAVHVELLQELADGSSGRKLSLLKGICAKKEYENLILFREAKEVEQSNEEIPLELEMKKFSYNGQEISKKKYTKFFDCDKIKNNLRLRFWHPGDYLFLREDGGKKKLNRIFIDEKIPESERKKIPLLADGNHILWMVGYRMSAYYKVTEKTKEILSITIKEKEKEKTYGR